MVSLSNLMIKLNPKVVKFTSIAMAFILGVKRWVLDVGSENEFMRYLDDPNDHFRLFKHALVFTNILSPNKGTL
jgi:hypothetical protein